MEWIQVSWFKPMEMVHMLTRGFQEISFCDDDFGRHSSFPKIGP
jgi:hypothetical protein